MAYLHQEFDGFLQVAPWPLLDVLETVRDAAGVKRRDQSTSLCSWTVVSKLEACGSSRAAVRCRFGY